MSQFDVYLAIIKFFDRFVTVFKKNSEYILEIFLLLLMFFFLADRFLFRLLGTLFPITSFAVCNLSKGNQHKPSNGVECYWEVIDLMEI